MRGAQDRQGSSMVLNQQPIAAIAFVKWIVCNAYTLHILCMLGCDKAKKI